MTNTLILAAEPASGSVHVSAAHIGISVGLLAVVLGLIYFGQISWLGAIVLVVAFIFGLAGWGPTASVSVGMPAQTVSTVPALAPPGASANH